MQPVYFLYIIIFVLIVISIGVSYGLAYHIYQTMFNSTTVTKTIHRLNKNALTSSAFKTFRDEHRQDFSTFKEVSIINDNLHLIGYIKENDSKVFVISLGGYKVDASRNYGMQSYLFKDKYNLLCIDSRGTGKSDGFQVTMGYKERSDLLKWIDYLIANYGADIQIILDGVSMGGNVVLIVSNKLPPQVKGIISDSGFTTIYDQLDYNLQSYYHLIKPLRMVILSFLNLLLKKNQQVELKTFSSIKCLKNAQCPVCFIYGNDDHFVSNEFVLANYEACTSQKEIHQIVNGKHLMNVFINEENYRYIVESFIEKCVN
jgi:hypothetical protein